MIMLKLKIWKQWHLKIGIIMSISTLLLFVELLLEKELLSNKKWHKKGIDMEGGSVTINEEGEGRSCQTSVPKNVNRSVWHFAFNYGITNQLFPLDFIQSDYFFNWFYCLVFGAINIFCQTNHCNGHITEKVAAKSMPKRYWYYVWTVNSP